LLREVAFQQRRAVLRARNAKPAVPEQGRVKLSWSDPDRGWLQQSDQAWCRVARPEPLSSGEQARVSSGELRRRMSPRAMPMGLNPGRRTRARRRQRRRAGPRPG
jgi:hypothetical protein